jgi:hypothetical protein
MTPLLPRTRVLPSSAAGPSSPSVLRLVRASLGLALVAAPEHTLAPLAGTPPDRAVRAFARVLGARHIAQAALLDGGGSAAHHVGAAVDGVHAATAAWWAWRHPRRRRLFALNALVAAALAADGLRSARAR